MPGRHETKGTPPGEDYTEPARDKEANGSAGETGLHDGRYRLHRRRAARDGKPGDDDLRRGGGHGLRLYERDRGVDRAACAHGRGSGDDHRRSDQEHNHHWRVRGTHAGGPGSSTTRASISFVACLRGKKTSLRASAKARFALHVWQGWRQTLRRGDGRTCDNWPRARGARRPPRRSF